MNSQAPLSKRSRFVGAANGLLPLFYTTGILDRPELDAGAICMQAERQTGLSDYGDEWFRQPLAKLVEALVEEASLNPLGLFAAAGQIKKVLSDRLHAQALFDIHPEIDERSVRSPVIVVGPMRSGTTRLHRLLAADNRFAHLRSFETVNPVPPPDFRPGERDRRWVTARVAMGAVHLANPTTACIHPSGPFEPEEELGLLVRSLWGMKHEAQWHVPSYGRWSDEQDPTPAYEYMARLLKLVGWARGEDDSRPWVLKTPQHMLDLPALLRVFPDARLIFTHREPRSVVGSSCSLVWNQMIIHSDDVDAQAVGQEWLRKTELQIERMRSARLAIPENQRLDVSYAEMESDWQAVMGRIYSFLDLDIGPAMQAMANYIADSGRELHRHPHRYSLSAFGLDEGEVSERFQCYTDAFDLPRPDLQPVTASHPILSPEPASRRRNPGVGTLSDASPARAAAGVRP